MSIHTLISPDLELKVHLRSSPRFSQTQLERECACLWWRSEPHKVWVVGGVMFHTLYVYITRFQNHSPQCCLFRKFFTKLSETLPKLFVPKLLTFPFRSIGTYVVHSAQSQTAWLTGVSAAFPSHSHTLGLPFDDRAKPRVGIGYRPC